MFTKKSNSEKDKPICKNQIKMKFQLNFDKPTFSKNVGVYLNDNLKTDSQQNPEWEKAVVLGCHPPSEKYSKSHLLCITTSFFSAVFNLFVHFKPFHWFHDWNQQKTSENEPKNMWFCLLIKAGWHAKLSFLVDFLLVND